MKDRPTSAWTCSALLLVVSAFYPAAATDKPTVPVPAGMTRVLQGAQPIGFGGGAIEPPTDFITDAQREAIRNEIDANLELLRVTGKLAPTAPNAHPLFGWPLRMAAGVSDPGYHGISNFVDLDPSFPNVLLDFNCGQRTYDTADGYNHAGTDFFTWPWGWRKMDRKEVEVVAVAPGQIIYRSDGNFDRSCGFNNNNNWNAIYVLHADGSQVWYGHMKNGSLTPKQVGDTVAQGEFLGVVGSSGNSTGPHLHLETYNSVGQLIEPWAGPCNTLNAETWWTSQRPYYDSAVDRITTGDGLVNFGACPAAESPNARVTFGVGPSIFFTTYYRDQLDTQPGVYTIYRPDGSVYTQVTHSSPVPFYNSSYWWWNYAIPSSEPEGTWRYTVEHQSVTYERKFTIGSPAACGSVPEKPVQGALLQAQKISTSIRLTWGASCNPQDADYVVYEGAIGDFANYAPFRCTTSGALAAVFAAPADSRFYLVGPRNATREGSLGLLGSGVERPVGTSSCVTRLALQCP